MIFSFICQANVTVMRIRGSIFFMVFFLCITHHPVSGADGEIFKGPGTNIRVGIVLAAGGNQEFAVKLFSSFAGVTDSKAIGVEGGLRIGLNLYKTYKTDNYLGELSASWYLGAVFGRVYRKDKQVFVGDEFKFAGSGLPANMQGASWGIGGVGLLTTAFRGDKISNYLGTQYIKGNFDNVSLTLNHTNDAMMVGFWLKKLLPPILGFRNTDWDRTTELSAVLTVSDRNTAVVAYGRASLFTPKILIRNGERQTIATGNTNANGQPQHQYILDNTSHNTFFSFWQFGITGQYKTGCATVNYSSGDPRPLMQNRIAHGNGYRFPLFTPAPGTSPNQSVSSLGIGAGWIPSIK